MTRYFYTNPLASAWMAKHFGMEFFFEHNGCAYLLTHWSDLFPASKNLIYYIHSDSLHLLEPREGDVIRGMSSYDRGAWVMHGDSDLAHLKSVQGIIISRNNIPFMWPEVEEC